MNYIKLQQDFIKKYLNRSFSKCYIFDDYENVKVSTDGIALYIVPCDLWVLDSKRFIKQWGECNFINDFCKVDNYHNAYLTPIKRKLATGKGTAVLVEDNSGNRCWINESYLKYFDVTAKFKILDSIHPVAVFENEKLVGIICVIRVTEDEDNNTES